VSITTEEEMEGMRAAGAVVARVLAALKAAVRPGVTTGELDALAARLIREQGAQSAPVLVYNFPGAVCISVNDEIVHGIPGQRILEEGDLVKLDVTLEKDGFMADAAVTVPVGEVSATARRLAACAEHAFQEAMQVAHAGQRVFEIGVVVEREVRRQGFSVVRDLCGHGIGRSIHEKPSVPNFFDPNAHEHLTEGLVIAVEPIIAAGSGRSLLARDGWTYKTADHKLAAHYEHTIVVTKDAPIILTAA
jgi:methionyl aminopeptidase